MRWTPGGRSVNVEDRRGEGSRFGLPGGGRGLGCGGIAILLILSIVFKQDFFRLFENVTNGDGTQTTETTGGGSMPRPPDSPEEAQLVQFVSFVLDDAQSTFAQAAPSLGTQYRDAKLVLFSDVTQSGCGFGQAATGPFYCPEDEKVYIDLGFYNDLRDRFGAPGDFAQAYVIAHELGHHLQKLAGIESQVRQAQRSNPEAANELSVRLELQADCLAGVWGHGAAQRGELESGDLEEGLNAAAAIGDDRLQKMGTGRVSPESWTHGSSAMRVEWFKRGLDSGDCTTCNTFADIGL